MKENAAAAVSPVAIGPADDDSEYLDMEVDP